METDEDGVLRVEATQKWLDEMENMLGEIAAGQPNILAYLKTLSEQKYLEPNAQLIRIRDYCKGVRDGIATLTDSKRLTYGLKTTRIYVTTSPTALPANPMSGRKLLIIYNNSNRIIYLGEGRVGGGTGLPLRPLQPLPVDATENCRWYGIISAGGVSAETRVLEGR